MELNEGAVKHARYAGQRANDALKSASRKITEKEERDALLAKAREVVRKGGDFARSSRQQVIDLSERVFPNRDKDKDEENEDDDGQPGEAAESADEEDKKSENDESPQSTPSPRKSVSPKHSSDINSLIDNSPVKGTPSSSPMEPSKKNSPAEQRPSKEVQRKESTDTFPIENSPANNQTIRPTITPTQAKKTKEKPLEISESKSKIKKQPQRNKPPPAKLIPSKSQSKSSPKSHSQNETPVEGPVPNLPGQTAPLKPSHQKTNNSPQTNPYPIEFPSGAYFVPPMFPYFNPNNFPPFFCNPLQPPPSVPPQKKTRHKCKQAWITDEDDCPQKYQLEKKLCRSLIRLMLEQKMCETGAPHPFSCNTAKGLCSHCGNTTRSTPMDSNMILTELLRRQESNAKCTRSQDITEINTPICRNPNQHSHLDLNTAVSVLNQLNQTLSSHTPRYIAESMPIQNNECITQSKQKDECKREFFVDMSEVMANEKEKNDKGFQTIQITISKENDKPIKRPICVNLDLKQLCEVVKNQNNESHFKNKNEDNDSRQKDIPCTRPNVEKKEAEYCSQKTQTSLMLITPTQEDKNLTLKNKEVQKHQNENCTQEEKMCICQFDEEQSRHMKDSLYTLKDINVCVNSIKNAMVQEIEKSKERVICCCQIKADGVSKQTSVSNKIGSKPSSQVVANYRNQNDYTRHMTENKSQESMNVFSAGSSRANSDINHQDSSDSKLSTESSSGIEYYKVLRIPHQFKGCSKDEYVLMKSCICNGHCNSRVTKKKNKKQDESLPVSQTRLHEKPGVESKESVKYYVCEQEKNAIPTFCTASAPSRKTAKSRDNHSSTLLHHNETIIQCTCHLKKTKTNNKENFKPTTQKLNQKPKDENESKHMSFGSDKLESTGGSTQSCEKNNTFDSLRDLYSSTSATPNISTIAHTGRKTSSSSQSTTSKAANLVDCVNNLKYEKCMRKQHDSKSSDNIIKEKVQKLPYEFFKNESGDGDLGTSENSITISSSQVTASEIENADWDNVIFERLKSVQKFISKAKRLDGIDLQLLKQKFETNIRQRHESTRQLKILSDEAAEEKDVKRKRKSREKSKHKDSYKIDGKRISARVHGRKESDSSNIADFLYSYLPFWFRETKDDGIVINIISKEDEGRKKSKTFEESEESKSEKKNMSSKEKKTIRNEKLSKHSKSTVGSKTRNNNKEKSESKDSRDSEQQYSKRVQHDQPCLDQTLVSDSHTPGKNSMEEEKLTKSEGCAETEPSQSGNTISTGELNSTKQVDGIDISSSGTNLISDTDPCTNDAQCCYEEVSCHACPKDHCAKDKKCCFEEDPCELCPKKGSQNDTGCCHEDVPCSVYPKEDNNSDIYYNDVNCTSPKQENYCNPQDRGGRTPRNAPTLENPHVKDRPCQGIRMYCKKKDTNKDKYKNPDYEKDTHNEKTSNDNSVQLEKPNPCIDNIGMRNPKENMEESKKQECRRQPCYRNCRPIRAPSCRNPKCYCTKTKQQISCDTLESSAAELNSSSWTPSFSSEAPVEAQAQGDTKQVESNDIKKQQDKCTEKVKDNSVKGTKGSEEKCKTKEHITDKHCLPKEKKGPKEPCVKDKTKYKEKDKDQARKKKSRQQNPNSSTSETSSSSFKNMFEYNCVEPLNKEIQKVAISKHSSGKIKDSLPPANRLKRNEMHQLNNRDFGSSVDPEPFNQMQQLSNALNNGVISKAHKHKKHKKDKDSLKAGQPDVRCACEDVTGQPDVRCACEDVTRQPDVRCACEDVTGQPDVRCACEDVLRCHSHTINKQHKKQHEEQNISHQPEHTEQNMGAEVLICHKHNRKHKKMHEDKLKSKTLPPVEECTPAEVSVCHKHRHYLHKKEEKNSKTVKSTDKNVPTNLLVCHKTKPCLDESTRVREHCQASSHNECSTQNLVCKPVKVVRLSKCNPVICEDATDHERYDQRCFEDDKLRSDTVFEDKPEIRQESFIKQNKESKEELENNAMNYITKLKCKMKIPRKIRVTFRQSKDPPRQSKEQYSTEDKFSTPNASSYDTQHLENRRNSYSMKGERSDNDFRVTQMQHDENLVNLSRKPSINGNQDTPVYRKSSKMEYSSSALPITENVYDERQSMNNLDYQGRSSRISDQNITQYQDTNEIENETAVHLSRKSSPFGKDSKTSFRRLAMMKKVSGNNLPVLFSSRKKSRSPSKSRKKITNDTRVNIKQVGHLKPRSMTRNCVSHNTNAVGVMPTENYHNSYQNNKVTLYPVPPPSIAKATELLKSFQNKCTSLLHRRSRGHSKARIMSVHERLYQQRKT